MTIDDKPTIGERYSSATESSNLKLGERRGDVDMIIAAGLTKDNLASALYRLMREYDAVRTEHRAADLMLRSRLAEAARQSNPEKAAELIHQAEGAALTEHLLILTHLRSLRETKDRFGEFAIQQATKHKFMRNDLDAIRIAGRVLDVWLRPACDKCDGQPFTAMNYSGEARKFCKPCQGSGLRRESIGRDDIERGFASRLLMDIDAKLHEAELDISRNLNAVGEAKDWIAEQSGVAL